MVIHKVDGQKVGVLLMQMEFFLSWIGLKNFLNLQRRCCHLLTSNERRHWVLPRSADTDSLFPQGSIVCVGLIAFAAKFSHSLLCASLYAVTRPSIVLPVS